MFFQIGIYFLQQGRPCSPWAKGASSPTDRKNWDEKEGMKDSSHSPITDFSCSDEQQMPAPHSSYELH